MRTPLHSPAGNPSGKINFFKIIITACIGYVALSHGINAGDAGVSIVKVGEYPFPIEGCGGIAYSGQGGLFYAVKDHEGPTGMHGATGIYPVEFDIDAHTGAIESQKIGRPFTPGNNRDSEGITIDPFSGGIWLADEFGYTPSIAEFDATGKASGRTAPIPDIQKKFHCDNQSLESLTIAPDGLTMWTANEQALMCDGRPAFENSDVHTVVRLMRFTRASAIANWELNGSWAYRCDPCAHSFSAQSGLSGLCALPDGSLLVLEREISVVTCGRSQLYRLTPQAIGAATEISDIPALTNATYTVINKGKCLARLNGTGLSAMTVYEGITLGPKLANGSQTLYLVSDGGEKRRKTIHGFTFNAQTVGRLCALLIFGIEERPATDSSVQPQSKSKQSPPPKPNRESARRKKAPVTR